MKIKRFALIGLLSIFLLSGLACGESGPTTEQQQPTATSAEPELSAPTLKAPKAAATILQTKPLFQWSGVGWADKYQIQVATDSGFGSSAMVINENLSNVQAFEATTELSYGVYYWRVKAMSDTSETEWSAMGVFNVVKEMPGD